MPRIFGLNPLAVLVAGFALWMVGFVFYGVLFAELWIGLWGFTDAHMVEAEAAAGPAMAAGFVLSIVFAGFLGYALKALKAHGMASAVKWALFLWAGFVVTTMAYDIVYALQPIMLLVLDASHNLVGFIVMALILTALDKVAVKD